MSGLSSCHIVYLVGGAVEAVPTAALTVRVLLGLSVLTGLTADGTGRRRSSQLELNLCQTEVQVRSGEQKATSYTKGTLKSLSEFNIRPESIWPSHVLALEM